MAKQKDKAEPVGGNKPVKKKNSPESNRKRSEALKGNKNAVGNKGTEKYIETPERLLDLFVAYAKDTKNNPFLKHDFVGKDATEVRKEIERPLTWVGFECYLFDQKIIGDLDDYEKNTNQSYTVYQPIIRAIKKYIDKDQFEGATAGIYNANIIARKLGLADKQELKVSEVEVFIGGENVTSEYEA